MMTLLKKLLRSIWPGPWFLAFFVLGIPAALEASLPYSGDWLTLAFIIYTAFYVWTDWIAHRSPLAEKISHRPDPGVVAPFTIGPIFKYFLLVPMPTEGMVVAVLDAIWYWDF
jgi:hypothetical protein